MKPISNAIAKALILSSIAVSSSLVAHTAAAQTAEAGAASSVRSQRNEKPSIPSKDAKRSKYQADATIAIKDKAQEQIVLPGVLTIPGAAADALDPTKANHLSFTDAGIKTIWMSDSQPNRIELPFKNPYITQRSSIQIDKRGTSNQLYVYWTTAKPESEVIYIEPPGGGPSFGLELVPKDIPAQAYIVTDDTGITAKHRKTRPSSDYIVHVQDIMQAAALGQVPDGFSKDQLNLPPIALDGLLATADVRYSSEDGDLYEYTITNPGNTNVTLDEHEFDGPSVRAISIFPRAVLRPLEKTQVFVFANKG